MTLRLDINSSRQIRTLLETDAPNIVEMAREIGVDLGTFFQGEDWTGLDLRPCDLSEVSFFGADMSRVTVYEDQLYHIAASRPLRFDNPSIHSRPKPPSLEREFSDLGLNPSVVRAIEEVGLKMPTPLQSGVIPAALEGRDVLAVLRVSTGKTEAFSLPMISILARGRARVRMPRSLVLCPTRELAAKVAENFDTYSSHVKLTKALLIGGVSFREQDNLIDKGVDVLIATPGRLLDHFERGKLLLTGVQVMVVDEADRMLDMGFIPDIERIFSLTPFTRQTLFFSATMAPEIERITNSFLSNPAKIEVAHQATAPETIEQAVVMFKGSRRDRAASEKRRCLRAIIEAEGENCTNAIIFCNRKTDVDILAKSLKKFDFDAEPIHGDLDQSRRRATLDAFRKGRLKMLVASDVAVRELDLPSVSHVFSYNVPGHAEDYVHRIGRAGRAGKAIMIFEPRDEKSVAVIEELIAMKLPIIEPPLRAAENLDGNEPQETQNQSVRTWSQRSAVQGKRHPT